MAKKKKFKDRIAELQARAAEEAKRAPKVEEPPPPPPPPPPEPPKKIKRPRYVRPARQEVPEKPRLNLEARKPASFSGRTLAQGVAKLLPKPGAKLPEEPGRPLV